MESTCKTTHVTIEVMPLSESSSSTCQTPSVDAPIDLPSPPQEVTSQQESSKLHDRAGKFQVQFKPGTPQKPKKKYKIYLRPMKSPGRRKNLRLGSSVAGPALQSNNSTENEEIETIDRTRVCDKSSVINLCGKTVIVKPEEDFSCDVDGVEATAQTNCYDFLWSDAMLFQENVENQNVLLATGYNYNSSELTPLKLDLRDHLLQWQSSPDLSKAIHESCGTLKGCSRLKTPRTLTRIMQQHRDNERFRHRGLNASINDIVGRLPRRSRNSHHETKIVKLKQIINYICHLESFILGLCGELGLDFDFRQLFMSPHISSLEVPRIFLPATGSLLHSSEEFTDAQILQSRITDDIMDAELCVDLTDDEEEEDDVEITFFKSGSRASRLFREEGSSAVEESLVGKAQDKVKPGGDGIKTESQKDLMAEDHMDISVFDHPCFTHPAEMSTCGGEDWENLCEGQTKENLSNTLAENHSQFTKKRSGDVFRTIDVNVLYSFTGENEEEKLSMYDTTHVEHPSTEWSIAADELLWQTTDGDIFQDENAGLNHLYKERKEYTGKTKARRHFDKKETCTKSGRPDNRRASWMNGFMMYSQLHRRDYIRANVGLRNAHVTKLIANDWRIMSPVEQKPYRDRARAVVESKMRVKKI